jgi:very-short-patch-repair endonuclease
MNSTDRLIAAFAECQRGLVTRRQLLRLRCVPAAIERRVATGRLVRILPAVYRVAGAPADLLQLVHAATLWTDPDGAASHATAAHLLHLASDPPERVDLTVPRERPLRSRVLDVHRTGEWPRIDRVTVDGIPCTSATRTLIDLAGGLDAERLEAMYHAARRLGLTSPAHFEARFARLGGRGRPGSGQLRRLIETERGSDRALESVLEVKAARLLRRSPLPAPVRQHWVTVAGGGRYRLDFAWPLYRVAVECDSFEWHGNRLRWKRDRRRVAAIEALGWRVLFVTWDDVVRHGPETVHRVGLALGLAAA